MQRELKAHLSAIWKTDNISALIHHRAVFSVVKRNVPDLIEGVKLLLQELPR